MRKGYWAMAALLALTAIVEADPVFQPKVKWLFASSGLYFNEWGGDGPDGNGFGWKIKDRSYNPPQTLSGVTFGGSMAVTSRVGLYLALPFFYNRIEGYTDTYDFHYDARSRKGLGDVEFGIPIKIGPVTLQPNFAGPIEHPNAIFYQPVYQDPWTGLGVYRASLAASLPWKAHYAWAGAERVMYKPGGDFPGLVEKGDFDFKGGYVYKQDWFPKTQWKAGLDASYNSFSWAGSKPQTQFSLDPRLSFSFCPEWSRELSVSASATLYSYQGGSRTFHTYGSRQVAIGLYYGIYR